MQHIPVSLPLCCCRVEYMGSVERAVTRLSSTTCVLPARQSAAGRVTKNAGYACGRQGTCTTVLCELSVGLTICLPPATSPTALTAPWSRPAYRKWGDNSQPTGASVMRACSARARKGVSVWLLSFSPLSQERCPCVRLPVFSAFTFSVGSVSTTTTNPK